MNVVTGVLVQTALQSARDEEDNFMTHQIVDIFEMSELDAQHTLITKDDIELSLQDSVLSKEWKTVGVTNEDARFLFGLLDLENVGQIAFEEFLGGCLRLNGEAKAVDLMTVMQEARKHNLIIENRVHRMNSQIEDIHQQIMGIRRHSKRSN